VLGDGRITGVYHQDGGIKKKNYHARRRGSQTTRNKKSRAENYKENSG
jgi:hypothetical protein